jgi:peptide-methionine (S)-S-oxide reductase
MRYLIGGIATLVGAAVGFGFAHRPAAPAHHAPIRGARAVGTNPGGIAPGKVVKALVPKPGDALAAFSAGCFWGVEEAYRGSPGVVATAVGYMGGSVPFPTYAQAHGSGAAETVLIEFDPAKTSYSALLGTFWKLHTPPSDNKADERAEKRSPYRSAIWTFDESESDAARTSLIRLQKQLHRSIFTKIEPVKPFYLAESSHQQYDEKTGFESCPIP